MARYAGLITPTLKARTPAQTALIALIKPITNHVYIKNKSMSNARQLKKLIKLLDIYKR